MEEDNQREFIDSLTRAAEDKGDIIEEERIKSGINKLKEILNG